MKLIGAIGNLVSVFCLLVAGCSRQSEPDPIEMPGQAGGTSGTAPREGVGGRVVGMPDAGAGGATATMGNKADAAMGTVVLTITSFPASSPMNAPLVAGVNALGQPQTFLIRNTGTAEAAVAVAITDDAMGQFVLAYNGCVETVVPPQGTCMIDVRLKPNSLGPKMGSLTASSGAVKASAPLVGTGILAPNLVATPPMHDFGNVLLNALGTPKVIVVSNTGMGASGAFGVAEVAGSSAWKIKEDRCMGMSLNMGQMCNITVNMEPTSIGAKVGTLTIMSASGGMFVVQLMGNAM